MAVLGDMVVNLTANTGQFRRKMSDAQQSVAGVQRSVGQSSAQLGKHNTVADASAMSMVKLGAAAAAVGVAYRTATKIVHAFTSAITASVKEAASVEMLGVQFKILLGNADEAQQMMRKLREFAAGTPFQLEDVANAGKTLLGFGFSAAEVVKNLEMMGKLAAVSNTPLSEIADILGKIKGMGKLQAVEGFRLTDRQINIYQLIADMTGKQIEDVRKMGEQGQISYKMVEDALLGVTTGQGKFANALLETSQTSQGLWSTLKDQVSFAAAEFGKFLDETFNLKGGMKGLTSAFKDNFLPWLQKTLTAIKPLLSAMAQMGEVGLRLGAVMAETFGEALLTVLTKMKPLLESIAESVEYWATKLGEGVQAIKEAKELVFGDKGGEGGIGTGIGRFLGDAIGEGFAEAKPIEIKPVDPGPGFSDAGGLGIQPGVNGGMFIPGEAPGSIAEKVQGAITGAGGLTGAGELPGFKNSIDRQSRDQQFAGAAEAGSAQAFSSMVRNIFGKPGGPQKETAKNTGILVKKTEETNQLIQGSVFKPTVVESFK